MNLATQILSFAVLSAGAAYAQCSGPITTERPTVTGPGSTGPIDGMSVTSGSDTLSLGQTLPALVTTRAGIAQRRIDAQIGSFAITGNTTPGDGGQGARYVPGRGYREIQDAAGTWWSLDLSPPVIPAGWGGVRENESSFAAANGIALNALIAALGARGGGVIVPPTGVIFTDRTIDIRYDNVLVRCTGTRASHDTGNAGPATTFRPVGGAFTVFRHRTPTAVERGVPAAQNYITTGGGFDGCAASGADIAPRLLHVTSVRYGTHRVYLENAVGTEAALYDTLADTRVQPGQTQDVGEASDNQHNTIDITFRQGDTAASSAADGVVFSGLPYNGNTSMNYGIKISGRAANGHAVRIVNGDNLDFKSILSNIVGGGTGRPILVQAGPPGYAIGAITVDNLSSGPHPGKVETLAERPGSIIEGDLVVSHLDAGNASLVPVGPNVIIDNVSPGSIYGGISVGKFFNGLAVGSDYTTSRTAQAYLKSIRNVNGQITQVTEGSTVHINADNSIRYLTRIDNGKLQFQSIAGTNTGFQFVQPVAFLNGVETRVVASSTAGDGVRVGAFVRAADPTTADIPGGQCAAWNNTGSNTYKYVCNFGGTLRSVAMN